MEQLESGFNGTINWNKGQSKITEQSPNRYLDFLIDPIDRNKKNINVKIDGRNFFGQPVKNV